ncbi:hypothetical protein M569_12142 [Genlisea aurea]|uniref:Wax synthase domain-containing protein n=1 Tax=Genlisea aurea TaxID=192259 RepID=S8DIJ3_9LAMI|nr:hypothetical protein M569_12142 [Genlisea aurea]
MEPELKCFIEIWLAAVASAVYCREIAGRIPAGAARLFAVLPVAYLFVALPFRLSYLSIRGGVTFFLLVWLANFKLLLFSFGAGSLAGNPPDSLLEFICTALLPVKIKRCRPSQFSADLPNPLIFLFKTVALVAIASSCYAYRESIDPNVVLFLCFCNVCLFMDLTSAAVRVALRVLLGAELEPHFDRPHLSTSLQNFWGRRWNLMVTDILRPSVYLPVRRLLSPLIGKRLGLSAAIFATFGVSALMHELIFYYLTARSNPTWEVTQFFLVHGFCVAVEVDVKKELRGGVTFPAVLSRVMTLGFVGITGKLLFFPPLMRHGIALESMDEYRTIVRFLNWEKIE